MNNPFRPSETPEPLFRVKDSPVPKIRIKPSTLPKLDPAEVAKVLGAKPAGVKVEAPTAGPITLFAVRQELFRRLQSSGGRPGLPDADKIAKVPLSETQWKQLEELAAAIAAPGFSPSAGQVANVLLAWALTRVKEDMTPETLKKLADEAKATEPLKK